MGDFGIQVAITKYFPIGEVFESIIEWLTDNLDIVFDVISNVIDFVLTSFYEFLMFFPPLLLIAVLGGGGLVDRKAQYRDIYPDRIFPYLRNGFVE